MKEIEAIRLQWFKQYTDRLSEGVVEPPKSGVRYQCPCCGYPTLRERGAYNICFLCNWEDDGQDDPRADEVWGGSNAHYSLTHARNNFKKYFLMYDPEDNDRPSRRQNETELNAKKAIVAAFDAMQHDNSRAAPEHVRIVLANYKILRRELYNWVNPQS